MTTKCIIVGLGYFGKIIKSKLVGKEVVTIDPVNTEATCKTINEVPPFNNAKWFVTTPASTHHEILLDLFEKGVKDIWVEKPICSKFEDTLDIFATIPDDVFLYCDFTWLQHSAVKALGKTCGDAPKHIELKWLNDGSMIPNDVNIVLDLAIHPLSIITYLLIKSKDKIKNIKIKYATKQSVIIEGYSDNGTTFYIEVSNSSLKKYRGISLYCSEKVYRWNSENQFYIENIGEVEETDAIEKNIDSFFNRINIGYPLDIARILEEVNKQFCIFNQS
jgi:predicted dehydrogenase